MAIDSLAELRATFIDSERESSTTVGYFAFDSAVATAAQLATARDGFCAAAAGMSTLTDMECSYTVRKISSFDTPTQSVYGDSEDKAFLVFRSPNLDGGMYTMQIPGPASTDFLLDAETLDPTNAGVAALITFVEGTLKTKGGLGSLKFILGYRRRRKSRKERPGIASAIG